MTRAAALLALLVVGCGTPAFTSTMRASHLPADVLVESRCIYLPDPFSSQAMELLSQDIGPGAYRLVYVGIYTSNKIAGFPSLFCFERPRISRIIQ